MHNEMVIKRGMAVEKLMYVLAAAPAMIFGLYPRKGTVDIGSDADLILFDPKISRRIRNEDLHQGTDHTIFEGWEVQGFPKMTLSQGKVLVEDGVWVGPESDGQWLARQIDPPLSKALPCERRLWVTVLINRKLLFSTKK